MKYFLDTDICIFYFRGKYNLHEKIDSVAIENCYVSEISLLELTYGAYNSAKFEKHIAEVFKLEELFSVLSIRPVRDLYGQERKRLKDDGNQIPNFDLLIGTTAKYHDMVMVTRNTKHFERIAGITLENWIEPTDNEFIKK